MYQMTSSNLSFNVHVHEIQISWLIYLRFYYYHWVDTSVVGLLVPEGTSIIRPVVSASALTWFIRYIYY